MIRFLPPANELKRKKNKDRDDEAEEATEEVLFFSVNFEYVSVHESLSMKRIFQIENLNLVISEEYCLNTKLAMSRLSEKEISFELIEVVTISKSLCFLFLFFFLYFLYSFSF